MRHGRYDSEYDRVRRTTAAQPEFPEPDAPRRREPTDAERKAAIPRVRQMADEVRAAADKRTPEQIEAEARRRVEADRKAVERNRVMVRREYEALGITPPQPLVALGTLKTMGWTVQRVGDRFELLRPGQ